MTNRVQNQTFSALDRAAVLQQLAQETYDVLIIGGGITGAGIALDAASRGMKVALVEMQDFAAGTSSRSTKLVHGGLRYLKQFEVQIVAEVGKERAIVYENGPHITTPEWMMLPFYRGGTYGKLMTYVGLTMYDWLAGVKRSERRSMLSYEQTLAREPLLNRQGLKGSGYYVEYRTDDARLTIEVLKKAMTFGACAVNYVRVEEFLYDEQGRINGALVRDLLSVPTQLSASHAPVKVTIQGQRPDPPHKPLHTPPRTLKIHAREVVNATGPWVQKLREADHSNFGKTLRLTKGVHLVFDQRRFPLHQAIYFDTADKRMMFAIPRDGKAYVGTTDTDYTGDIAHPTVTEEDITYILQATNDLFPMQQLTREDIESSWAGLRPLIYEEGKNPSEVSRRDEIFQSDSGLITIAGGKLTGYRKMGEHVTDLLARRRVKAGLARKIAPCVTKTLRLSGGDFPGGAARMPDYLAVSAQKLMKRNIPHAEARMLAHRYGTNVDALLEYIDTAPQEEAQRYGLPVGLYATVRYSIEHEMAQTPLDFFLRRTGALLFNVHWTVQWKSAVCTAMAALLHYSAEQRQLYEHELLTALTEAVPHDF